MNELVEKKANGNFGVLTTLTMLSMSISPEEFELFCANVPSGADLWVAFKARRDAPDTPEKYGIVEYAREILDGLKQQN